MIYINAGHHLNDSGHVESDGTKENEIVMKIRDALTPMLTNYDVDCVPDTLDLKWSIQYVNKKATKNDFAIDIHLNANNNKQVNGVEAYYVTDPKYATVFSRSVANALNLKNRGALPDSITSVGSLGWLRYLKCPSVLIEVCYLTNDHDRISLLQGIENAAIGIKNGIDELFQKVEETTLTTFQLMLLVIKAKLALIQELVAKLSK